MLDCVIHFETFCNVHCPMFLLILFLGISFRSSKFRGQKISRGKKIRENFGINFHELQDDSFSKNKLSRTGRNQILQAHKFSRG